MDQDRTRKLAAIADLVRDVRLARAAGKGADDDAIVGAHPELGPELGEELEKLRRVAEARRAAATDEAAAGNVMEELARPDIRAAGYSVLKEVNRGGQAVVYLAVQLSTGRKVALKVMRDGPLADERALGRFRREVQVLAALNHPHIVTILDTGVTSDGSRYLAMNYIAGHSLDAYMRHWHKQDPADPGKLIRLFLKICAAVNEAHLRGVVHRDLKPTNIRIDERGEPHILDFGLARTGLDTVVTGGDRPVSITGEFLGSLPWSSPEQAEGDPEKIDTRTDVYALGVILYQMLTGGRFPYQVVGNIRDVLTNIIEAEPTPPSVVMEGVGEGRRMKVRLPVINEGIERVVLKALSKNRERRYQSAGEMGRDVASYLSGQPVWGRPGGRGVEVRPFGGRVGRWVAVTIGLGVLVGGIVVGVRVATRGRGAVPIDPGVVVSVKEDRLVRQEAGVPVAPAKSPTSVAVSVEIPAGAVAYRGRHYLFVAGAGSWGEAAGRCREMGGYLARAKTGEEWGFLERVKGEGVTAWLGGERDDKGSWVWEDGTAIGGTETLTTAGFDRLFMMRDGRPGARREDGEIEGAAVPRVEGFICQWEK